MSPLNEAVRLGICVGLLSLFVSATEAQTVNDPGLRVKEVVVGLSQPTTMQFIGPDDILALQKGDGRVRRVLGGVLQPGEVLDLAVDSTSECGLLGIAVHPEFPAKSFVYLLYTESSAGLDTSDSPAPLGNRVYRFTWDGGRLTNPTLLLDLPVTPEPNHDGGIIVFGPDGRLYATGNCRVFLTDRRTDSENPRATATDSDTPCRRPRCGSGPRTPTW